MTQNLKRTCLLMALLLAFLFSQGGAASAADPVIAALDVEGNEHVITDHILGVVGSRVGEPLSREQLQSDVEAIYGLGFFSFVDIDLRSVAGGAAVTFLVTENPVVEAVTFTGNNIFKSEELMKVVFTAPGNVFNRVFFQHDLDRIQEKYNKAGYVMVKISDVRLRAASSRLRSWSPGGNIIIRATRRPRPRLLKGNSS